MRGKVVGGETIRPMLKFLAQADVEARRARMETPYNLAWLRPTSVSGTVAAAGLGWYQRRP